MTKLRIGNAPCSWGTLEFEQTSGNKIPYDLMLDELTDSGYTGTELGDWGYMPTDPSTLQSELRRRKLCMLGAFVPVALSDSRAHGAGVETACRIARLVAAVASEPKPFPVLADNNGTVPLRTANAGRVKPSDGLTSAQWAVFAQGANAIARVVYRETGVRTVFHHHAAGYVETHEEISHFLALTDPNLLGLVFDTGHYAFGAGTHDVVSGLESFKDRIWYVHFKDLDSNIFVRTSAEQWDYFTALRHGLFCELGMGCVDFPAVLRWLRANQYEGYVLVEQDVLPGFGSPKESACRNRQYLASIERNYD